MTFLTLRTKRKSSLHRYWTVNHSACLNFTQGLGSQTAEVFTSLGDGFGREAYLPCMCNPGAGKTLQVADAGVSYLRMPVRTYLGKRNKKDVVVRTNKHCGPFTTSADRDRCSGVKTHTSVTAERANQSRGRLNRASNQLFLKCQHATHGSAEVPKSKTRSLHRLFMQ